MRVSRPPIVIGHRANSLRVLLLYRASRVDHVEIDVALQGNRLVAMHGPPSLKRASPIGGLAQWVDYKLFYRDPLVKPRPLAEWIRVVNRYLSPRGILLDLKASVPPSLLESEIEESGYNGRIYVSSNDHRLISKISRALPGVTALASYSIVPADPVKCTLMANASGAGFRIDMLDSEIASMVRGAGLILYTWTVNSREHAEKALRLGADIIISDRPGLVLGVIGRGSRGKTGG